MTTAPLYSAEKYTYRVTRSEDDRQYVGVCSEFPSLRHLAGSHDEALDGIFGPVRDAIADMVRSRQEPPVSSAVRLVRGSTDRG